MAVDMFLKLDSVDGESTDSTHADEIDLLSWTFSAAQAGTAGTGPGTGSGKVSIQDIAITKRVDRSSPILFYMCATGSHLKEATLTVRKAGGTEPVEYLVCKMEHVLVTGYSTNGSQGQEELVEQVSLSFKKVGFVYTPQLDDGTGGPTIEKGWNVGENVEWTP